MTKIVHGSDWHAGSFKVPAADLYIFTGDMLPDFCSEKYGRLVFNYDKIKAWRDARAGKYRQLLGNPDAPVIVCRGNHDRCELAPLYGGEVYEIGLKYTEYDVLGLKIGGLRGVLPISGDWMDEQPESAFDLDFVDELPDILVTHSPPYGFLDEAYGTKLGSQNLAKFAGRCNAAQHSLIHCFGHIHEDHGVLTSGTVTFSNAATTFNVLDI